MNYFESNLKLRHIDAGRVNHYEIHQQIEGIIAGDITGDKIKSKYLFDYIIKKENGASSSAFISVRSIEPTNLPGEKALNIKFKIGDKIKFAIHFMPMETKTHGKRRRFITDKVKREERLITRMSHSGMDAIYVDEIEITNHFFEKENRSFGLSAVRYIVEATITDPAEFEMGFAYGLGGKSSFGYGKITLLGS